MALEEIKQPYEVLFRLDQNGNVAGKHVGILSTITKDDVIVSRSQIPVMSFEEAEEHGFDVQELAEFFNTALWSENNTMQAQQDTLLAELQNAADANAQLHADKESLIVERAALLAEVEALKSENAALLAQLVPHPSDNELEGDEAAPVM